MNRLAFAALLPVRSVGVMGDNRTYEQVIALRAVQTTDFMTADWYPMDYEVIKKISSRIINEVKGIFFSLCPFQVNLLQVSTESSMTSAPNPQVPLVSASGYSYHRHRSVSLCVEWE